MCLMALSVQAQRCAVLDFNVGENLTVEDVDGISYMFSSNFNPAGYKMLERPYINRVIQDKGYERTDMTLRQRLAVGRELTATIIVVGDVNIFMDEYNIDVRVVSVETGATVASETASFERTAYRDKIKTIANNLANKVGGVQSQSEQKQESSEKTVKTEKAEKTENVVPRGYVDLGLPSGTLWKVINEGMYDWNTAMNKFGNNLPSQGQWEELKDYCTWTWNGSGYKVTGLNGNFIVLSAAGYRDNEGSICDVGSYGEYWSSTPGGSDRGICLWFNSERVGIDNQSRYYGDSVRLVMNP